MGNINILRLSYGEYVSLKDYLKLQQENEQLKEQLEKMKQPQIFVDTDIEERYGYELENDYLIKQLQQRDEVIEEILNYPIFEDDCPFSQTGNDEIQKLCDCENCKDDCRHCWLKYFENNCKGDNNE